MTQLNAHQAGPHAHARFPSALFFYVLVVLAASALAQARAVYQSSGLETEQIGNQQRIAQIDNEAAPLARRLQQLQQLIEEHNHHQPNRTDQAAVAAYNVRSEELNREKGDLIARLKALEDEQDRLKARDAQIAASIKAAVEREQAEFNSMNQAWLRNQENLIRQRTKADLVWQRAVLKSLHDIKVPPPSHPASFADLLPGDVVLFEPESGWNSVIPPLDYLYRVAEDLADGDIHAAIQRRPAPVSHALTFVKRTNGVLLFLDHTNEGSRVIDEHQLEVKYKDRPRYLARPVTVPDGRLLWSAARQAALQQKSHFGVLPGQRVCSEQVCVLVARSSAIDLESHRLGPIDVTPGDFFDAKATGKYFIVSRFE